MGNSCVKERSKRKINTARTVTSNGKNVSLFVLEVDDMQRQGGPFHTCFFESTHGRKT